MNFEFGVPNYRQLLLVLDWLWMEFAYTQIRCSYFANLMEAVLHYRMMRIRLQQLKGKVDFS